MTRDKHIEMAQRLGLVGMRPHLDGIYIDALAAFAKLVADDARATPALPDGMAIVPVEKTFEAGALAFKKLMIEASHAAIHPHIEGVYGVFEHRLAAAKEKQS